MKKITILLLLTAFMSCSKLDSKCGSDIQTVNNDLKILVENGKITNEEFSLLADRIYNSDTEKIAGKTYREILEKAKLLAIVRKAERERKLTELNNSLAISLNKENKVIYRNHTMIYPFEITNKTEKEIRGISGTVIVTDLVDNELGKYEMNYDEKINSASTNKINYSNFDDKYRNREILKKGIKKLKVKWIPKEIIFTQDYKKSIGNTEDIQISLKKRYIGGGYYRNDWNFLLEFKNNSDKTIVAFNGKMKVTDLFGNSFREFDFVVDDEIKPNFTTQKNFRTSSSDDKGNYRFKSKKIENFKLEWNIEKIVVN